MAGDSITLNNGAKPVIHHTWKGGRGDMPHLGLVLAKTGMGIHPWVTWRMASSDGQTWDCYHGRYHKQMVDGFRSYKERRGQVPNG